MKRQRGRRNPNESSKKVIRCSKLLKPVFEQDKCDEFKSNISKETERICKNCIYSF